MSKRGNGEGTITKRSDGRYMARVTIGRDLNGEMIRKAVYGSSKQEVVKKMTQIQAQVFSGVYQEPSQMTLEQWLSSWYETYKKINLRPQTKELYEILMKTMIIPKMGNKKIKEIRPMHIQALFNEFNSEGYSTSTLQKIKNILNPAFKLAVSNKLISDSPVIDVQLPPKKEKQVRAFSVSEQEAFEKCAEKSNFFEVFIFALDAGLRCGELLALTWDDINFANGEVKVNKTLIEITDEKLEKLVAIPQNMPKTQSGNRTIPLTKRSIKLLEDLKNKRIDTGFNDNNIVFCSKAGTYVFHKNLRRSMDSVCTHAGIEKCGIHTLRHTFATRLFEQNVQAKTISELLGHSRIEITLNIYTHVSPDNKKSAIEVLNKLRDDD